MAFRLVGTIEDQAVDLFLPKGRSVLGSDLQSDLVLVHASVSRRHAALEPEAHAILVKDLGSRNGTSVAGHRVSETRISVGDEVRFGKVRLRVESIPEGDLTTGVRLGADSSIESIIGDEAVSTFGFRAMDSFLNDRLPQLLDMILDGAPVGRVAQAVGAALHDSLAIVETRIEYGDATLFSAERRHDGKGASATQYCRGPITLSTRLADPAAESAFTPLMRSAVTIVAMAAARELPLPPQRERERPQLPEPETVDAEMRAIYTEATQIAAGDVGVLVCGESGTGKEVLARYVHAASPRANRPFVALNCAALPRELLEAELFGIERGVATGVDARAGKFEAADGGTLFLDEIGDMSIDTQATLLRALQEKTVFRVGGQVARNADARVIAATNRNMETLLADGSFREDLYYRITTWEVTLPPLRHRRGDITNLAVFFLERETERRGIRVKGISEAALETILAYRWPGNVRQLQKEMARAALFVSEGGLLATAHLSPKLVAESERVVPLAKRLEAFERSQLVDAIARTAGDVTSAATALGLGRSTLYRRLSVFGIDPSEYAPNDREPG